MSRTVLSLSILPDIFAICRLAHAGPLPKWAPSSDFFSITQTSDELSIVCEQSRVPAGTKCQAEWRCIRVAGTLDFSMTGIVASLVAPLAAAAISVFVISTFDTDYLLAKSDRLNNAISVLQAAGHSFAS